MHYLPNTANTEAELLKELGLKDYAELLQAIPPAILQRCQINLPEPLSEDDLASLMIKLAAQNLTTTNHISFLGGGVYDHFIPAVVDFLINRSEFYTAYTPYQPEVSQGTLQAIYEYQSLICQLTAMEVANASLYDGPTALAEAAIMASNITGRRRLLVSPLINPNWLAVLRTYCQARGLELRFLPEDQGLTSWSTLEQELNSDIAALLVQSPNFLGHLEQLEGLAERVHQHQALLVMAFDPISLAILKTPGELNVDIAVAEGQALGIHQSFGGPFLGLFATKRNYIRHLPGRLVGETVDIEGKRGYVLVLQTREQHIRREKATSNICTNEGLMALAATIYLALMGKNGLKRVAELCFHNSHYLAERIAKLAGYALPYPGPFFKEFVVQTPVPASLIVSKAAEAGIIAGLDLGRVRPEWQNYLLIAVTERRNLTAMDRLVDFLSKV